MTPFIQHHNHDFFKAACQNVSSTKAAYKLIHNEINKLTKQDKKNLVEISKLSFTINSLGDSIKKLNNKLIDSTYNPITGLNNYNFELRDSTKFRELRGIIKVTSKDKPFKVDTELLIDKVYTDLTIGKTLKNDKLELFVSSSNSKLLVTIDTSFDKVDSIISDTEVKDAVVVSPSDSMPLPLKIGYQLTIGGPKLPDDKNYQKFSDFIKTGNQKNIRSYSYNPLLPAQDLQKAEVRGSDGT